MKYSRGYSKSTRLSSQSGKKKQKNRGLWIWINGVYIQTMHQNEICLIIALDYKGK